MKIIQLFISLALLTSCKCYKILAIFPYNGRSHHIYFSSLVQELATRNHDVTVINYFPVKKLPKLRQISLMSGDKSSDFVNMEEHLNTAPSLSFLRDIFNSYSTAKAFEYIANSNCEKLMTNDEVRGIIQSGEHFELVIAEQFVTDCGLAIAYKLKAPVIGTTAHILMPWTYSRLGAPNNPSFVPNHFIYSRSKPDIFERLRSTFINGFFNYFYTYVIQKNDYEIIRSFYPETPDLETLGRNISLILLNQYFPLTGSRLYGANVIEIGGLHIKQMKDPLDQDLSTHLDSAENGAVFISFGSVAKRFPRRVLEEIIKVVRKSNMNFVWKVDVDDLKVTNNTLVGKWFPQSSILCHTKVKAFVSHSGMLSSSEAMHCGVPIVSVPLFGDQFANAASAVENGLGVTIDIETLDEKTLTKALDTVLQDGYQNRAKELSQIWRDRPMSPMNTAIYWIEYIARHNGNVNLRPPTVDLPLYQYLMLDVFTILFLIAIAKIIVIYKIFKFIRNMFWSVERERNRQIKRIAKKTK